MRNKVKKIAIIIGAFLIVALGGSSVFAEDILSSMTVSPPYDKVILTPGDTYKNSLKISNSNENKNDLKYSVSIGSFSEVSDGRENNEHGTVDHISRSNYNQIMDWIKLEKTSGTVAPNSTDELTYTIEVPENAPAGGQYATLIVRDETGSGAVDDGNVAIQNVIQFATIIYAEVAGETREAGSVISNNVPTLSFSTPLTVSSIVRNDGNVHTDAEYKLQVYSLFSDQELYSNEEKPKTSLILPESERYNTQEWAEAPTIGIFRVKQTISIFGDVSTVEKIVIICPFWLLFIIVVAIIAIVWWLISKSKNRKKS